MNNKPNINIDLSSLLNPGLYKITCTQNNKVYIGQSSNVLSRLGRHTESLEKNRHDCLELQEDFHLYSKDNIVLEILEIGSQYENEEFRKERENFFIEQISQELRYNKGNSTESYTSQAIQIRGRVYPSFSNAAKILGESRTNIKRQALNPNNGDYTLVSTLETQK